MLNRKAVIVNDILKENLSELRYVFVLESPHKDELKAGIPLCGVAGKCAASVLELSEISLGHFAYGRDDTAILNISISPLQCIGNQMYPYLEEKNVMDFVRNNSSSLCNHKQNNDKDFVNRVHDLEEYLLQNFKKRFDQIYESNSKIKVILCGKFAQNYFKKCYEEQLNKIEYHDIIHPSYSNWSEKKFMKREKRNPEVHKEKELLKELRKYYKNH